MTDIEIETREVTRTEHYVELGGEKLGVAEVLDFLDAIEGTDGFAPLRWSREYDHVAEALMDEGIVSRTARGSWYEADLVARTELYDQLLEQYIEATDG